MSYNFAKVLGCNPIIFTGLDLAFIDNKVYATGQELVVDRNGYVQLGYDAFKKLTYVKGINGEKIPSRDDYALFIRHFEDIFAKNTDTRIINTSIAGAKIEGMEYARFDDLIDTLTPCNIAVDAALDEVFSRTANNWQNLNSNVYLEFKKQLDQILEIDILATPVFAELNEICRLFEAKDPKMNIIQAKIQNIKDKIIYIRNKVVNNPVLSNYLQGEILQYAKSYNTNILPTIENVKQNMQTEYEFFNMISWATKNSTEWLNEAIQNFETDNFLLTGLINK